VITLSAEGKVSLSLTITVYAPCCELGEGAPTASIQQAFRDAVARNKLSVQLPTASTVVRTGGGYTQQVLSTGTAPLPYLVAVPDGSVAGFVVGGAILSQYLSLGGPTGALGYPVSDATPGGRQIFQRGTLAGNPVQVVSGAILAKWSDLGYETGALGSPTGAAATFLTFRATAGAAQPFQNGLIMSPSTGPLAGQSFVIVGAVLAAYLSAGGASGDLGSPINDEHPAAGLRQQDFEGGYINYAGGSEAANIVRTERQPLVTAAPRSVVSGSVVHLAVGGFNNDATVRVSQTGQPDFLVKVPSGAYTWDGWVPRTASDGVITVRAVDINTNAAAQGSYTVRSPSAAGITISIVSGDLQEGAPGAQLTQPLVVAVTDLDGNVLADQSVTFAASPGAQITPLRATTDSNGEARAFLRLPPSAGVALATAQAGIRVVTFSARASAFSLANFPALTQDVAGALGNGADTIRQKGALLTSAAVIVRYLQSRNELGQANGLADPATLNTFLKSFCFFDSQSSRICDGFISLESSAEQTLNLWRLGAFTGDEIEVRVESSNLDTVRDLVAGGSPVLLALSLDGAGSHFVVATGLAANGSVRISDPNPAFGQTSLDAYLNGFTAGGSAMRGTLSGAVRLMPRAARTAGFLVTSTQPVEMSSASGACGQTLQFPSIAAVAGTALARRPGVLHFRFCEGSADTYQLELTAPANAVFTSLTANGGRAVLDGTTSSLAVRSGSDWSLSPVAVSIRTAGVVNAATFGPEIAPGGLISIFGAGFTGAGSETAVEINGEPAAVIAALPFQVNAQVPPQIQPGSVLIKVTSPNGGAQQQASIRDVAPAIFSISPAQAAITNQDNSLNAPSNPARRGETIVIYGTGFGAVIQSGTVQPAAAPVTAVIGGVEVPAAFAGLTPGAIGLYQANVALPATLPPGLALPLYLKQAGAVSNTVMLAVQ
jgi:uncharacterized protein (TIGR03437 family)